MANDLFMYFSVILKYLPHFVTKSLFSFFKHSLVYIILDEKRNPEKKESFIHPNALVCPVSIRSIYGNLSNGEKQTDELLKKSYFDPLPP